MEKPFFQISCKDNINVETRALLNTIAPTYHVIFDHMKHLGFTDAKFYISMKALVGKMNPDDMYDNLSYCHNTFFDKYLRGLEKEPVGLGTDGISYIKVR